MVENARDLPPPPARNDSGEEASGDGTMFLTFSAVPSHNHGENSLTSQQGENSLSINSGSDSHITPSRDELLDLRTIDKPCTLGNQGQSRAKAVGDMRIRVDQEEGKIHGGTIALKDMLWVPGIPCLRVGYGNIQRTGR